MPLSQSIPASLERVTQLSVIAVLNQLTGLLIPDMRSDLPHSRSMVLTLYLRAQNTCPPKFFFRRRIINMEFITKERSLEEVKEMGYAIALYPVLAFDCAIQGAFRACKSLIEKGRHIEMEDAHFTIMN